MCPTWCWPKLNLYEILHIDRFSPFPRLDVRHNLNDSVFLAASTFSLGSSDRRATQSFSAVNYCLIRAGPVSATRKLSRNGVRGDESHHRFTNKMAALKYARGFGVPANNLAPLDSRR